MDRVLGRTEIQIRPPRSHILKQRAGQILDWLDRHRPDFRGYSWCALPEP